MLIRSMRTRFFSASTRSTLPRLPRSFPATTSTVSPFCTCAIAMAFSDNLGSERNDLRELLVPELARHRPADPGAHGVVVGLEQHDGVPVEADVRAVLPADLFHRSRHLRPRDLPLLDRAVRHRFLDGND